MTVLLGVGQEPFVGNVRVVIAAVKAVTSVASSIGDNIDGV